jgi:hypothetical protein
MPSAVRFTDWISLASIPAVNCWAIISRPLRGLVELLFMQGKGKLLVCDSGFAAVQRRCSRDPGTLIRLCVADARSDGASFFWRHERSPKRRRPKRNFGLIRRRKAARQPQKTESLRQARWKLYDHLCRKVFRLQQHRRSIYSDRYRKRSRHS